VGTPEAQGEIGISLRAVARIADKRALQLPLGVRGASKHPARVPRQAFA
jgi:hypothetical protein